MKQDYWYFRTPYARHPSGKGVYRTFGDRVRNILKRISREKYLYPDDVYDIAYKICCKISNSPCAVMNGINYWDSEIFHVGMINGEPLLKRYEPGYLDLVVFLENKTNWKDKKIETELKILKMFIGINDRRSYIKRKEEKLERIGLY